MLPVIYSGISYIEISKRIFVYILLIIDHVCLVSIEMFKIYYTMYINQTL